MEDLRFCYYREYWYISAFINTNEIIGEVKAEEIEDLLLNRFKNLDDKYFSKSFEILEKYPKADEKKNILRDMLKHVSIECDWEPVFQNFPYTDENKPYTEDNRELVYNTLGYFNFKVEFYHNDQLKKESITPDLIQQVTFIVLALLSEFVKSPGNDFLLMDLNSPIYSFIISNRIAPYEIQWNKENIQKYKKVIGDWTQIYSGQWTDYSDELYQSRIVNNLSNRLSELHYISRNSGFIYMTEENYKTEFPYIRKHILEPTPKMRAVLFAIMTIDHSLDILFMKRYSDMFMSLELIEQKTKNLRYLRGMIQTKMSLIYTELDWNPRQHYTKVLTHLLEINRIETVIKRVNEKFKMLYDSMQEFYLKRNENNQKMTKRVLYLLNILLGAGIINDFIGAIRIALGVGDLDPISIALHIMISIIIGVMLVLLFLFFLYSRIKSPAFDKGYTVDAVILDKSNNIILVKRKYPPYQGKYALPGGFIKFAENPEQALLREVKEETNLTVKIVKKIGTYGQKGRDPRGRIITTAYRCELFKDVSGLKGGDDITVAEVMPISKLNEIELAFDHKQILRDAGLLR